MDESPNNNRFMDSLLFRFLKGDTTAAEEEKVSEWRASAPENEQYFLELDGLLSLTAGAFDPGAESEEPPSGEELLGLGVGGSSAPSGRAAPHLRPDRGRGHDRGRDRDRGRVRDPSRGVWLMGGVGATAAAILLLLFSQPDPNASADLLSLGVDEFATGATDVATVQLRDGTIVRLAPRSRLRLSGSVNEREVMLDGRAYFAVAKMDGHPFTVKTRGGDAVVLGTRFEAEAMGDELRVLVVEGSVALAASGNRVELVAGEMARAVEGAVSAAVSVPDPQRNIAWVGDFLVFQRTPVRDVATEIRQHFDIEVDVLGDDLDEHTVTAWFADPTVESVIRVVCKVLAAECTLNDARVEIDLNPTTAARSVLP